MMDVFEAIFTRQSIGKVSSAPVPTRIIKKLLAAAVQAPNHYQVRPWRFVVITGEGRVKLGEVMAGSLKLNQPGLPEEALEKARGRPLRAPVLIAAGVDKPDRPTLPGIENVCAVAAACQNLALAAHAEGLGLKWRTGDPAYDPGVKEFLGFERDQHLVGFLYIGYPAAISRVVERPSFEDRTRWIER